MSGLPLLVEMQGVPVLVVGAGQVATRRAERLVTAGARLRVIAPDVSAEMDALAHRHDFPVERRAYASSDVADAVLVLAATNDAGVNAQVLRDAASAHRLGSAADGAGTPVFSLMASHASGPLTIGVSAGGVPAAAMRIRNAIAERFDSRYADVLAMLSTRRRSLLAAGDAAEWQRQSAALIGPDFCETVERGGLRARMDAWR